MTYVYLIQQGYGGIKIGVSDDPSVRCAQMQTGASKVLRVLARFPLPCRAAAFGLERELHRKFAHLRGRGEWFKPALLREMKVGGRRVIGGTKRNPAGGHADQIIEV